ncbi:MAG TPA: MarR family transcriptional regulator [Burkholderiales bacterium]|nr:MarR family transcriptional regulator [Burkholderiales bacterium]
MAVETHDTVPFLLARVATLMNAWHADFRKLGLSVLSVRVMAVLSLNGGATVGELAEATSIDQSTLSHILRRLERARLVEKARQDHDNRSVRITTTPKGRALAKKCHDTAVKHDAMLTRGLSAAQVRDLKKALSRLYANVNSVPGT